MSETPAPETEDTPEARWRTLAMLEDWLDGPMLVLSFLWLVLVIYELAAGSSQALETFGTAIWVAFLLEFALRLALAPEKGRFLARNWLTVIALVVPAFRLRGLRLLRLARVAEGIVDPRRAIGYRRGATSTLWLKTSGRSAITVARGISWPWKSGVRTSILQSGA